ncbi:MAG: exodeoxyribonuclease VII large subunit [Caldithrix sp.]|nr:exodeoxyribonuclease VII large subunit [Caldithrix sp.]
MAEDHIYSISELTQAIKLLLEESLPMLWIEGEVSNFKPHYSGHYYFTLKDDNAQISAVMWRSRAENVNFEIEDGMQVQAYGRIRVYEKYGRYQIDVQQLQKAGIGRLQAEFERLKQKLDREGLFESQHKQALPNHPQRIGIITSSTGAALRDILNVLKRRAPHVEVIVRSTQVQGTKAAEDIALAIDEFNQFGQVDLLIVGRGGGSLEDLWAFNEEVVARAIYHSKLPVVSAVGHEIDFTIADFVSDLRAPTPSAAAELITPDYREVAVMINTHYKRMKQLMENKMQIMRDKVVALQRSYGLRRPGDVLKQHAYQLDELTDKLKQRYRLIINTHRQYINQLDVRLKSLSPKSVLNRGYTLTYVDGKIMDTIKKAPDKGQLKTEFKDGALISDIKEKHHA